MHRILFAGQPDSGFFLHLLSTLHPQLDGPTRHILRSLQGIPLQQGLESAQACGNPYSLILPGWLDVQAHEVRRDLHQSLALVAEDANAGRCRVFFDACNESCQTQWPQAIAALASDAGIHQLRAIQLISQNRLMADQDLPILHACADLFPVCAWHACRELLLQEGLDPEAGGAALPESRHQILCLNATPRKHRLLLLLKLAAAGLIDLHAPDHAEHCQIPYVSFPGLSYDKGQAINLNAVRKGLAESNQHHLLACLDPLLARLPLRVDNLPATGNALALEIDLHHYRDSKISLVSETGMDPDHCRITEKTLKPLALGQPCISFSHRHSLRCAREMGYATYDDCIDNSYDSEPDWLRRMDAGIGSACHFLHAYNHDAELRQRVQATSLANRRWTLSGFAQHYFEHFARPLLERLIWRDGPETAQLKPGLPSPDIPAHPVSERSHNMDGDQHASRMATRHGLVGPADLWEMKRRFQIEFLKGVGLLPHQQLLDLGCGTLRGGIPLIAYLDVGHYTGIEVRPAVLEEGRRELEEAGLVNRAPRLLCGSDLRELEVGRRFDVIWAFAVLIHLSDSVLDGALEFVARHLDSEGTFYATVNIGAWPEGSWQGFPIVSRTMEFYQEAVARHGLTLTDIGSLKSLGHVHPRLSEQRQARQRMLCITHLS